jgi:hypothetical protein
LRPPAAKEITELQIPDTSKAHLTDQREAIIAHIIHVHPVASLCERDGPRGNTCLYHQPQTDPSPWSLFPISCLSHLTMMLLQQFLFRLNVDQHIRHPIHLRQHLIFNPVRNRMA